MSNRTEPVLSGDRSLKRTTVNAYHEGTPFLGLAMMESDTNPMSMLNTSDMLRVDAICVQFEKAWKSGTPPALEDYVHEHESSEFATALFWGLMHVELEYREKLLGRKLISADYTNRFPNHKDCIERLLPNEEASTLDQIPRREPDEETIDHAPKSATEISGKFRPIDFPMPFDVYVLRDLIAIAGQGVVYKASPAAGDDFIVALKRIKTGVLATDGEVQRFKLEAQALCKLNHPNIVPIYHVGEFGDQYYFTMKYISGKPFKERLAEFQTDPRKVAALMAKVARAIHYAHKHGILHRDLKPGNILLEGDEEPLVIDFGLAKRINKKTGDDAVICGTINYMPLEQADPTASDTPLTTAVDIYSLGAVLYRSLTGRAPYQANSFQEFLHEIRTTDPPRPSQLNPNIPYGLELICLHCLEKEPEKRYDSAEELAEDLESWLEHGTASVIPDNPAKRVVRWARKHPAIAVLTLVLIGLVFAFTILGWKQAHEIGLALEREQVERRAKEDALEASEWLQYRSQMELAYRDLLNGNDPEAGELLKSCPGTYRNWEYEYLLRFYEDLKPIVFSHKDLVWNIALNPSNPQQLAAVEADGTLTIRDRTSGKLLVQKKAHKQDAWTLDWTRNGKWLATGSKDGTLKLWQWDGIQTLTEKQTLRKQAPGKDQPEVWALAFGPEGKTLYAGWDDGELSRWELKETNGILQAVEGSQTVNEDPSVVWEIRFSPNGSLVTACGKFQTESIVQEPGSIRYYDADTLKPLTTKNKTDHRCACTSFAFSPDGNWFVTTGYDRTINVYHREDTTQPYMWKYRIQRHTDDRVISVNFTPDSRYFATGSWDQTVKLWDVETGQLERQFLGHGGPIAGLLFADEGASLITASGEYKKGGAVRIWDWNIAKHAARSNALHERDVRAVVFSPEKTNPVIASAGADGCIQLWWPNGDKQKRLYTSDASSAIPVNALAFHPNNANILVSGHEDGTIRQWNIGTGEETGTFEEQALAVLALAFSPTGDRLIVGLGDRTQRDKSRSVGVWDMANRTRIYSELMNPCSVFSVAVNPNGTQVASASGHYDILKRRYKNGTVKLWSLESGEFLEDARLTHLSKVECVRFSPDGTLLATASSDQSILLTPLKNNGKPKRLKGHTADVYQVAFSPNGTRLASASLDHTVRIWDVAHGQDVLTLATEDECRSVAFSPNGRYLAVGLGNGSVNLYDCGRSLP